MDINDQKEFLDGILNLHKHDQNQDSGYSINSIIQELNRKINSDKKTSERGLDVDLDESIFLKDGSIDIENLFKCTEELDIDPIDIVEYCVNQIQSLGQFSHFGQTIDFSSANSKFQELKKQFEEYKKSEDINNF